MFEIFSQRFGCCFGLDNPMGRYDTKYFIFFFYFRFLDFFPYIFLCVYLTLLNVYMIISPPFLHSHSLPSRKAPQQQFFLYCLACFFFCCYLELVFCFSSPLCMEHERIQELVGCWLLLLFLGRKNNNHIIHIILIWCARTYNCVYFFMLSWNNNKK